MPSAVAFMQSAYLTWNLKNDDDSLNLVYLPDKLTLPPAPPHGQH
jgi:hypothetical protein